MLELCYVGSIDNQKNQRLFKQYKNDINQVIIVLNTKITYFPLLFSNKGFDYMF